MSNGFGNSVIITFKNVPFERKATVGAKQPMWQRLKAPCKVFDYWQWFRETLLCFVQLFYAVQALLHMGDALHAIENK